jgi:hypothetical protein
VFGDTSSEHPFYLHPAGGNMFAPIVFGTVGPSNAQTKLHDLLVPPDDRNKLAALARPVGLNVSSGAKAPYRSGIDAPSGRRRIAVHPQWGGRF